ncbi:MAG TPA: LLM class F420-dependent oxidoreductase [Acidimicrobiales bacterium]|nr:LLM class F420-dependent oxidoreductase [Acidimicrobiales bacterium]
MRVDANLPKAIGQTESAAAQLQADGFDGIWIGETQHDPFLMALRAADATETPTVGTAVAIAFARSPMTLAYSGWDLADYSRGRFVLGLGSQVKPHIERRFSMPWSHPAARMRELVLALRAIWHSWSDGSSLDFRGDFYTHNLMTPFFRPEPHSWGAPPVLLAGVGERMTEVAGEVADGFLFHAFTTAPYLADVTLPALKRGRGAAGRDALGSFDIAGPAFVATGRDEAELARAVRGTRAQIAFYASTPAYRPVLEHHGWADLQPELTKLSKEGRWEDMGDAIDDEVLHAFAVVGPPEEAGRGLRERWAGTATRITLYTPYPCDPETLRQVAGAARG